MQALCWLGLPGALRADVTSPKGDKDKGPIPPSPRPALVKGLRGVPVKIILQAVTGETRAVEFLIRDLPRHGTLTEPVILPREGVNDRAMVIYTAGTGEDIESDQFTFAAKLSGGPTSGAVPVNIIVEPPRPQLETFKQLDFDDVMVGESYPRNLLVKNTGTGPFIENVQLEPPFYVADPANAFEVPAGAERLLRVIYAPSEPADDKLFVKLGGGSEEGGSEVLLLGRGVAPFAATPPLLRMAWNPELNARSATLTVFNNTAGSKTITVTANPRVRVPTIIALGPKESADIPISVGGDNAAYEGDMKLTWNAYTQPVKIVAAAEPAVLAVVGESGAGEPVVIPATLTGSERLVPVTVTNVGGQPGDVLAEATTPFFVKQSDRSFVLPNGEERIILVGMNSSVVGDFKGTLQVFCDGRETALPILGPVVNTLADAAEPDEALQANRRREDALAAARKRFGAENPTIAPQRSGAKKDVGKLTGEALKFHAGLFEKGISPTRNYVAGVPSIKTWGLRGRSTKDITIGWFPPEEPGEYRYEVEYQRLLYVPKAKRMMKVWEKFPEQEVGSIDKDGVIPAKLTGLKPGTLQTFRVVVHKIGVGWSAPSKELRMSTERAASVPWRWIIIGLMAATLAGIFVFKPQVE